MKLLKPEDGDFRSMQDLETEAVAYGLPGHMMTLMFLEAQKRGWELRMDIVDKLGKSAAVPLVNFDMLTVSRLAKQMDEHAIALLDDLSPDEPIDGLHTIAMFVLLLVQEGLLKDPRAMCVMVALMLMEDVKDGGGNWPFKERWLKEKAGRVLSRARMRGLYLRRMTDSVVLTE